MLFRFVEEGTFYVFIKANLYLYLVKTNIEYYFYLARMPVLISALVGAY